MIVDKEHYLNRLRAYGREHMHSDRVRAAWDADAQDLGSRIGATYDLACRGTHADATLAEARMCLIHTYLLIADLLQLGTPTEPE